MKVASTVRRGMVGKGVRKNYLAGHPPYLQTKAGIADKYTPEEKRKLIEAAVEGNKGGSLAKSVQAIDPTFPLDLLADLSKSVEAEYKVTVREQKKLRDLDRQFRDAAQDPIGSMFLSASQKEPVEFKLITSTRSRAAQESGVDDNVDIFKH